MICYLVTKSAKPDRWEWPVGTFQSAQEAIDAAQTAGAVMPSEVSTIVDGLSPDAGGRDRNQYEARFPVVGHEHQTGYWVAIEAQRW